MEVSEASVGGRQGGLVGRAERSEDPTRKWQVIALCVAAAVIVAGKEYYRTATPADLRWVLAPAAHAVTALGFGHFAFDAQLGYVDPQQSFAIAPACAGIHFALAAFLALTIGGLAGMRDARSTAKRLAAALAIAYVATIVVNTVRIAIALAMRRPDLHQMEGTLVYLGGLLAIYALARRQHALAH
jgi:exosortase K